ncbi:MAG: methylmalonyl Co-A mutase-associated GTPase MeaB [Bacteroidetes bacterium]|nr:methylmalonyl Co-A mutase-associated GTPase MeaB [Bacteroidota bacterium]
MSNNRKPEFFIQGILKSDIAVLSRAITLVESQKETHQQLAQQILSGIIHKTGNSFRLGITGVPGVGKSTFIESFGKEVIANQHKLAVLAIDPSSTKSKGSILGDKTRMEDLSKNENVFIRPSPSGGTLGGLTRATYETMLLCEAAGFDFIIIETVGVGQSETAVSGITDFFLLLMLAGAGDELQGIKRGIMEMADALVITKADGENLAKAKAARAEYAHAMHLLQAAESGWRARTQICSSVNNFGMAEIYTMIVEYKQFVTANNYFFEKRKQQQYELLLKTIDEQLRHAFYSNPEIKKQLEQLKSRSEKENLPFSLGVELVKKFLGK